MALINCLVLSPSLLDIRLRVRESFIQAGLLPVLEVLPLLLFVFVFIFTLINLGIKMIGKENEEDENYSGLTKQLQVFQEKMDDDEGEEQEFISNLQLQLEYLF